MTTDLAEPDRAVFFDVNRARLRGWCWGDPDAPPVLLVHGAFDHGRTFDGFAPRLVELGLQPIAIDVRGHGDSQRLASGMTWAAASIDLCELARVLAPEPGTPIGMIGHSMGGGMVLTAAGLAPERVAWTVVLDGMGPPAEEFAARDPVEAASASLDQIDRIQTSPPRPRPSRAEIAERRGAINVRLHREFLDHLVEHGTREVEGGFVWKWDPLFRTGFSDGFGIDMIVAQYRWVEAPTLALVSSEQDAWTELDDAEVDRRVRALQDGRWQSVPGAGHYVHVEEPDFVAAAIAEFLTDIGAR